MNPPLASFPLKSYFQLSASTLRYLWQFGFSPGFFLAGFAEPGILCPLAGKLAPGILHCFSPPGRYKNQISDWYFAKSKSWHIPSSRCSSANTLLTRKNPRKWFSIIVNVFFPIADSSLLFDAAGARIRQTRSQNAIPRIPTRYGVTGPLLKLLHQDGEYPIVWP